MPYSFFTVVMKKLFALLAAIFLAGMIVAEELEVKADAVENTTTPKATYKFLEGGSVVIKKNGITYSVNGQRVQ